jgi:hypothetical protein
MVLKKSKRMYPVDVLDFDYQYSTIKYYVTGNRNDIGEPDRILLKRGGNVKCSIDPLVKMPGYINQSGVRDLLQQGVVERSAYIMTLLADQIIEPGDVITDCNNISYNVIQVMNWYTHKEAFLKIIA